MQGPSPGNVLKDPTPQLTHSRDVAFRVNPEGQTQTEVPACATWFPVHVEHDSEPDKENVLIGHIVHIAEPAGAKVPGRHSVQVDIKLEPMKDEFVPAGHLVHAELLAVSLYVPATHFIQLPADVKE